MSGEERDQAIEEAARLSNELEGAKAENARLAADAKLALDILRRTNKVLAVMRSLLTEVRPVVGAMAMLMGKASDEGASALRLFEEIEAVLAGTPEEEEGTVQ
jgi:hypothetical protein